MVATQEAGSRTVESVDSLSEPCRGLPCFPKEVPALVNRAFFFSVLSHICDRAGDERHSDLL